jgi:hypothetical protein
MSFFLIHSSEDGTTVTQLTEAELLKRITPDADGNTYYGSELTFLDKITDSDGGCWMAPEGSVVIIKGEIIQPKPVSMVTKFSL